MQFIQARTGSDLLSESSDLNPKVCGICAHGWPNKTKPMSVTVTCVSFGVPTPPQAGRYFCMCLAKYT